MKKWKLLPILGLTATVATLGSTLVACNKGEEEELKFTVSKGVLTSDKTATIKLDFAPTSYKIEYIQTEFIFAYNSGQSFATVVDPVWGEQHPLVINLTFEETITEINDGILTFQYYDGTTKKAMIHNINNIVIDEFDYVLEDWDKETQGLLLTNVSFISGTEYKIKVDLQKIPSNSTPTGDFEIHNPGGPGNITKWQVFYDGSEMSKTESQTDPYVGTQQTEDITPIVIYNLTIDKSKQLYFSLTFNADIESTWLWFHC